MRSFLFYFSILCFLLVSPVLSGDLYHLGINSSDDLEAVRKVVDYAYGMVGDRFLVELSANQTRSLRLANIHMEKIIDDFELEKYYLVRSFHEEINQTPIALSPIYSYMNCHIVRLDEGSDQVLLRSGYMVRKVGAQQTPLFFNASGGENLVILESYPTDTLADMVNSDSLFNYVVRMQQFDTRFMGSDSIPFVVDWLENKFVEFGYSMNDISHIPFSTGAYFCGSFAGSNVVLTKPGSVNPDKYILVGGHYDSYRDACCYDFNVRAPGADDDASGVSGVLELARLFNNFNNNKTIMFVPFGGEELGLYGGFGSGFVAQFLYDNGLDLEFMVALDMIGYTDDDVPDIKLIYSNDDKYKEVFIRSLENISGLIPDPTHGTFADDIPFSDMGFKTIGLHEGDFNYPGYHNLGDVYTRMDFLYLDQVIRAFVATIAVLDQTPDPLVFRVNDMGDGQSVRVSWDDSGPAGEYTLIWGPLPTFLDDTINVPSGITSYDLDGLLGGVDYYFGVYHTVDGIPQLAFSTIGASSQIIPRAPAGLMAAPDTVAVALIWKGNPELDLSYYKIFKKAGDGDWMLLEDNYADTAYLDTDVVAQTEYAYRLCAVDLDGFVSDSSDVVSCWLASFDGGILLVDETQSGGINPSEGAQSGFYRQIMDTLPFETWRLDSAGDQLGHNVVSRYCPMLWVDDDNVTHLWQDYVDTMSWYFDYGNDFLFAGWQSISALTGFTYFYPGDFLYDEFGISYAGHNILNRFVGALGESDWPDLQVRTDAPNNGHLNNIQVFGPAAGAEVIYRFDSDPYHSGYQDRPVGIAYDTYDGKRVILGFPLYWLTRESAQALIVRVMEYFAAESPPLPPVYGDVTGDREVNILDVTYLIQYIYQSGPPPPEINNGDPNGDCTINILDVSYLIGYLYMGGPAPVEGCIE